MVKFIQKKEDPAPEISSQEWLQETIAKAINLGASDIHIEPEQTKLLVRFRIDGLLREVESLDLLYLNQFISCLKVMAGLNIAETRRPQDGHISFYSKLLNRPEAVDIRLSIFPSVYGEVGVLRILSRNDLIFEDLSGLDFEAEDFERLSFVLKQSEGMILVTGPGGSGKTTTLYTILNSLRSSQRNIVTLEDPVELRLDGVRQSQVHPEVGFDFAQGLRSILRQDANVVMVGEIRDDETAEISIRASLTGILFFSTIHTTNSVGAIVRFLELGIPRSLVASALRVIITKRLVRNICPKCRTKAEPSERLMELCRIPKEHKNKFYQGRGCEYCFNSGYRGRSGIHEIMFITDEIQRLIMEGAPFLEIELQARKNGMKTLKDVAVMKALSGLITLDEVIRVTPLH